MTEVPVASRVAETLARARTLAGTDSDSAGVGAAAEVSLLLDALGALVETDLAAPTTEVERRFAALLELRDLRDELQSVGQARRLASLEQVQRGLSRLRGIDSVAAMMERVPVVLCEGCGFDRAMLTRVEGSTIVVHSVHASDDPDLATRAAEFAKVARPQLDHNLIETEMLRRRGPILIPDVDKEPRANRAWMEFLDTQGYVGAPIMPSGRVIGFLQADLHASGRVPDEIDRDRLWAFAEGFGYAIERTALLERLRRQKADLTRSLSEAGALVSDFDETGVEMLASDDETAAITRTVAALVAPLDGLLTRREQEVLALLAKGASNAGIGERLVISQGTVKSHVQSILRKLGAANRADAVGRYLQMDHAGS